ncbi:hypothetical protein A6B35_16325 [Mesorhizobium amorphae CCNWGS0123]|nr:hypothetical protein A6B35_16325 [Mesorhizobium amorphae CCNWGS0123]
MRFAGSRVRAPPVASFQGALDLRDKRIERGANGAGILLIDQQRLQRRRPRADLRKAERPGRTRQRVGEPDQRIVAGQGSALTRGLQLRELIGAPGKETLAERGEGIGGDGECSVAGWWDI